MWKPQAVRLGLRYVAHVIQADRRFDVLTERLPGSLPFELQIFQDVAQAQHWLRRCRAAPAAA